MLLLGAAAMAQAPQKFNYQTVVRDNAGNVLGGQAVGLQITIRQGSASGMIVYRETHAVTTTSIGLANLSLGGGTVVTGTFNTIDWSAGPYFVEMGLDPAGGTSYTSMGTQQLLSVPYALYAENSGTPGPAGPTGPTGPTGPAGSNGTNGASFLSGSGAPTAGTGVDGDTYVDLTTGDTYTKSGGAWTATGNNLMGPTGPTGPAGATGPTGATGPQGPAGPIGGSDTQIIYNNTGTASGSPFLTWNDALSTLTVMGTSVTANERVTSLGGAGTRYVTTDNAGNLSAVTFPGITGSGNANYHVKFTGLTTIGNSLIQDNGTSVAVNFPPQSAYQFYVYRQQQTVNGDGQYTIFGQRDRNSQNDGTGYGQAFSNSGVMGQSFWGDLYSFGTSGYNYNDFTRTGGVLGSEINGNYWGSLGYKSSASVTFGVYGSNAYGSGSGYMQSSSMAGMGGGFFGNVAGSISRGRVIGQMTAGELFAAYNSGDVYTYGQQIELVKTGERNTAVYTATSTDATVYKMGKARLVNGSAYIRFDSDFAQLLGDAPVVTATPMGVCNGVYISSADKTGFTITELNNGNSNVELSWIAMGLRVDGNHEIPAMVKDGQFDSNIRSAMYDDGNLDGLGEGIWWDGTTLRFGKIPAELIPNARRDGTTK